MPTLKVASATLNAIVISWTIESATTDDHEQNPVTGYLLYSKKADQSDWKEIRLSPEQTQHQFDFLSCGSKYQFYVIAFNSVGKGEPSSILSTKTEGMTPVAPHKNSMLNVNTSAVSVDLDAWHDGSCRIQMFKMFYKPHKARKWTTFSENVLPEQRSVTIADLAPGTMYDLKITAYNEAGSTEALYSFTTVSLIKGNSLTRHHFRFRRKSLKAMIADRSICPIDLTLICTFSQRRPSFWATKRTVRPLPVRSTWTSACCCRHRSRW